jgi:hypothetical protein
MLIPDDEDSDVKAGMIDETGDDVLTSKPQDIITDSEMDNKSKN